MYLHEALPFLLQGEDYEIYNTESGTELEVWRYATRPPVVKTSKNHYDWIPSYEDLISDKWEHCT